MEKRIALGWRFIDHAASFNQLIFVGYPHTTRWDFALTQAIRLRTGRRLTTLVIESEFSGLQGSLLRALNCIPVPVKGGSETVSKTIIQLAQFPDASVALCPEGRIEWSERWRTGYWVMSFVTGIPVCYVAFDYVRRCITMHEPVRMTGNTVDDLAYAESLFKETSGFRAEDAGRIAFPEGWVIDPVRCLRQRRLWEASGNPRRTIALSR